MRDKSHIEQVERWARYVRDNPETWKQEHKQFINAQIELAEKFYVNLSKTEEGLKILAKLKEAKLFIKV